MVVVVEEKFDRSVLYDPKFKEDIVARLIRIDKVFRNTSKTKTPEKIIDVLVDVCRTWYKPSNKRTTNFSMFAKKLRVLITTNTYEILDFCEERYVTIDKYIFSFVDRIALSHSNDPASAPYNASRLDRIVVFAIRSLLNDSFKGVRGTEGSTYVDISTQYRFDALVRKLTTIAQNIDEEVRGSRDSVLRRRVLDPSLVINHAALTDFVVKCVTGERVVEGLTVGPDFVTYTPYYNSEHKVMDFISSREDERVLLSRTLLDSIIDLYCYRYDKNLDSAQRAAVHRCLNHRVSILTGGPGRGKTTVCDCIVWCHSLLVTGQPPILMSYTNKAVSNLVKNVVSSRYSLSGTIHSLSMMNGPRAEPFRAGHNQLVIVDEVSMADVTVFAKACSISEHGHLVIVGDENQLPSIGPGNVLSNLLSSGRVATSVLEKNYRVYGGDDGPLEKAAQAVLAAPSEGDVTFVEGSTPATEDGFEHIAWPCFVGIDISEGDQVSGGESADSLVDDFTKDFLLGDYVNNSETAILTPHSSSDIFGSTIWFNEKIKERVNPDNKPIKDGEFGLHDRILIIENTEKDKGLYKGMVGNVSKDSHDSVTLTMDDLDKPVVLNKQNRKFDNLIKLGYAMTIHKAQGSQYKKVMLFINGGKFNKKHLGFGSTNLLYTAITRVRNELAIYGSVAGYKRLAQEKLGTRDTFIRKEWL